MITEGSKQVPQKSMEEFVAEVPGTSAANKKLSLGDRKGEPGRRVGRGQGRGQELAGDKSWQGTRQGGGPGSWPQRRPGFLHARYTYM